MAVYIVTYDLNNETVRPDIVAEVKSGGDWAKLSESSYAISTNEEPEEVYARFTEYLDEDDALYVISLARPYAGQGPDDVNEWLRQHVR